MKEITLGQYYPIKSPIHSLDPRTKIICAVLLVTFVFISGTFAGLAVSTAFVLAVAFIGKIPIKKLLQSVSGILILLLITFILNMFFYHEGKIIFSLWKIQLTTGGILRALFMAVRLLLLVVGAGLLTLTTSPIELTDGLESIFSPLKKIGFPAHEIAMMMSIALRFIPILSEETDKIMKAQSARGAVFDEGSIFKRAKAIVSLLIPLLVSAFRRAEELAMAMEARCYHGGEGRTRLKVLKMTKKDTFAYLLISALCLILLADRLFIASALPFLKG